MIITMKAAGAALAAAMIGVASASWAQGTSGGGIGSPGTPQGATTGPSGGALGGSTAGTPGISAPGSSTPPSCAGLTGLALDQCRRRESSPGALGSPTDGLGGSSTSCLGLSGLALEQCLRRGASSGGLGGASSGSTLSR